MSAILSNNLAKDGTTAAIETNTNIKRILVLPTIRGHVLSMPKMTVQLVVSVGGRRLEGSV